MSSVFFTQKSEQIQFLSLQWSHWNHWDFVMFLKFHTLYWLDNCVLISVRPSAGCPQNSSPLTVSGKVVSLGTRRLPPKVNFNYLPLWPGQRRSDRIHQVFSGLEEATQVPHPVCAWGSLKLSHVTLRQWRACRLRGCKHSLWLKDEPTKPLTMKPIFTLHMLMVPKCSDLQCCRVFYVRV